MTSISKTCTKCSENKPLELFVKRQSTADGHATFCRDCHRWHTIFKKYGISKAEFMVMWEHQNWVCAICEGSDWSGRFSELPHVDHCHNTGKVRGLLCNWCNAHLIPAIQLAGINHIDNTINKTLNYLASEGYMVIDRNRPHPNPRRFNKADQIIINNQKQCVGRYGCNEWKNITEFTWRNREQHWRPYCNKCSIPRNRWAQFRILPHEYSELKSLQNGTCAICQTSSTKLEIDHCHKTNMIRGLLCNNCNSKLLPAIERWPVDKRETICYNVVRYLNAGVAQW